MLILRDEQIRALCEPLRRELELSVIAQVEEQFADTCQALGKEGTREVVRTGIARADDRGLEADRDVRTYVALMFTFGRDFDSDPSLPWAVSALAARPARMDRLKTGAMQHLAEARGLDGAATGAPESDEE